MLEILLAGGWLMLPIIICSILAMAITLERLWALRPSAVMPKHLVAQLWHWHRNDEIDRGRLKEIRDGSALGQLLAACLANAHLQREALKETVEDTGRHIGHELERYLNFLGTVAEIAPLLGLLGTVIGMIKVFLVITTAGVGDPGVLAGGISEALVTTAAGLGVAIPSVMAYRYLRRRVDELLVGMEREALKLVDALHGGQRLAAAR